MEIERLLQDLCTHWMVWIASTETLLKKEGVSPRFMLIKQRSSVHGMEFNYTDAVKQLQRW
jgi:hypothetical protein